jgi:hemoglobin-like flavoprotein
MTPESRRLVKESWARLEPIAEAAALFYGRLFELDPALRHLFLNDMAQQGRTFMQTLGMAVRGLDRLEEMVPALESLGRRHGAFGVRDAHYETVERALLWTLERGLGDAFTPAVREAWSDACGLLAEVMKRAGRGAPGLPETVRLHATRRAAALAD